MGALPAKVLQLLYDEYKLQISVEADVGSLVEELNNMHTALSKLSQVPRDKPDDEAKLWAHDFREASYDIEDILDTFLVRVHGGPDKVPRRQRRRLISKMAEWFCSGKKVLARHEIATTIVDIRKRLDQIQGRHERYRVDHLVEKTHGATSTINLRISALLKKASDLIGIDEPRDTVIDMLSQGKNNDKFSKKVKIVCIVGSGGLGKTTLAKAAYDKIKLQFDCWALVSVGQNPDHTKVLRELLVDLIKNEVEKTTIDQDKNTIIDHDNKRYPISADTMGLTADELIIRICEFLDGKRWFIVVDDIWDGKIWVEAIEQAFVASNPGSRIIVTTRKSEVAKNIGVDEQYPIQPLSEGYSKMLLSKISGIEDKLLDHDDVVKKILDKCDGVPLAITAIASVLATKPRHEWSNVYNSIFFNSSVGFGAETNPRLNNVKKILSFSYYDLPFHLRTCMLYLSVFPEDDYVDKNMLIWRWIAEGLVHTETENGNNDLFKVGERYFHELISRGLIQPIEDGGVLVGCHVHDFVLHLIRELSREEDFVSVLDGEQRSLSLPQGKVRRLALQNILDTKNRGTVKVDDLRMPVARSFNAMYTNMVTPTDGFELLRVLALEYCWVKEDYLKLIGKLRHLRYLGLTGTRIRNLPEEVGHLKFLQTLMLHETGIEELPRSLEQLTQLMCLRGDEKTRVPEWIGKLTSLLELRMYPGAEGKCFVQELGKLRHIRVLKAEINLKDEGEERDLLESLSKLEEAESIVVSTMGVIKLREGVMQPILVLNCKNVRVLDLRALIFPRRPACINAQDLPELNKLCLCVGVLEQDDVQIIGMFQQLLDLSISGPVPDGCDSIIVSSGAGFQNLATLSYSANIKFVAGAMPRLENIKLWINAYDVLDVRNHVLGLGLGNIYSLQQVTAIIVCSNCFRAEVEEMEAAVSHVVDIHPNWPTLYMMRYGEEGMATTDSGLLDRWKIKVPSDHELIG
ncbi:hypothetical protein HU200_066268 [Digitaria exilis]|uniref:Uncharacterized protein n=1 Tax=Digitaria exilis TaxID=1010633 RepID=A0A835A1B8_9POAL|nr:hypothetical protein HU200_066268 [Digitaria exilis]